MLENTEERWRMERRNGFPLLWFQALLPSVYVTQDVSGDWRYMTCCCHEGKNPSMKSTALQILLVIFKSQDNRHWTNAAFNKFCSHFFKQNKLQLRWIVYFMLHFAVMLSSIVVLCSNRKVFKNPIKHLAFSYVLAAMQLGFIITKGC